MSPCVRENIESVQPTVTGVFNWKVHPRFHTFRRFSAAQRGSSDGVVMGGGDVSISPIVLPGGTQLQAAMSASIRPANMSLSETRLFCI